MNKVTLNITGMTCGHCVAAVTKALQAVPGVTAANVNLEKKQAVIEGTSEVAPLITAIVDAGYEANRAG